MPGRNWRQSVRMRDARDKHCSVHEAAPSKSNRHFRITKSNLYQTLPDVNYPPKEKKAIKIDLLSVAWNKQFTLRTQICHFLPTLKYQEPMSNTYLISTMKGTGPKYPELLKTIFFSHYGLTVLFTDHKDECRRTDAFELCWRRLLRVPWTARSNQSILKKISPEYSLKD